jgi:hypothetical protein
MLIPCIALVVFQRQLIDGTYDTRRSNTSRIHGLTTTLSREHHRRILPLS